MIALVILGGILALHFSGHMIVVNHIWNHELGRLPKTPEAVQSFHRLMALLFIKVSFSAIIFWGGLWGLLRSKGCK